MKKKILSSLLSLCVLLAMLPCLMPAAKAAGQTISSADIVSLAKGLVGQYPYVSGGESPSEGGFDCTGLVYYVYHTRLGHPMTLVQARSKSGLLSLGQKIENKSDFQPGDVVQFTYPHVAIYIGNNKIIEAAKRGTYIRESSIANRNDVEYAVRLPQVSQNGPAAVQPEAPPQPSAPPQYFDCDVMITCVEGQVVNLYNNPGDGSRADYFSKGQSSHSDYGATLSDGSTWYRISAYSGDTLRDFWLKYESGKMSVEEIRYEPPAPCSHNWGAGEVTKAATLTDSGIRTYTCSSCGETKTETIDRLYSISLPYTDTIDLFISEEGLLQLDGSGRITARLKDFVRNDFRMEDYMDLVTTLSVEEGITYIAQDAFSGFSNLETVKLPATLTNLDNSFAGCTSLKRLEIPSHVSDISSTVFEGCPNLSNVTVASGNNDYTARSNVLFDKNMRTLVACPRGKAGDYEIPDGVTELGANAFRRCGNLTSVTIPESVTEIGETCFADRRDADGTFRAELFVYAGSYGERYAKENNMIHTVISACDNGHTWDAGSMTTEPTTTSTGIKTYTCTVCGQRKTQTVDKLPLPAVLDHFTQSAVYYSGLFTDVTDEAWYSPNVASAYQFGLMNGTGQSMFSPDNNITVAEAVTLAARLHRIYDTGAADFRADDSGRWYDPYVNYARDNALITENYDYALPATREEFAHILAQALPEEALAPNRDKAIRFADAESIAYQHDIDLLCQAGVIAGVPGDGAIYFKPQDMITRAEVAAIITRMVQPGLRI